MALHLVYGKLNTKFESTIFGITNQVENKFEPNKIKTMFKSTFALENLCIMIITCII